MERRPDGHFIARPKVSGSNLGKNGDENGAPGFVISVRCATPQLTSDCSLVHPQSHLHMQLDLQLEC